MNNRLGLWPFDIFSSKDDSSGDRAAGERILKAYYEKAILYPTNFKFSTFKAFVDSLEGKIPGYTASVGELVRINWRSTDESSAIKRVIDLADRSKGSAHLSQIISTAGMGKDVRWVAGTSQIAAETIKDAAQKGVETLSSVGTGLISTVKLTRYLPIIIGAGVLVAVYAFSNSTSKKIIGLKK